MKFYLKNITYALLLVLILSACSESIAPIPSQNKVKSESKLAIDINTGLELYKVYYKEFNSNGNLVTYLVYNDIGSIKSKSDFVYDNLEKKEIKETFDDNGNLITQEHYNYYIDLNGNLIKYTTSDVKGNVISTTSYVYDLNGNVLKELVQNVNDNNAISEKEYNYQYNSNGNLELLTVKDSKSNSIISKDSIFYVSNENVLEKFNLDNLGNIIKVNKLFYNKNGRINSETELNKDGKIVKKYLFRYTYF